ncbi:MAG: hypothetical protein AAF750_07795 [Planctomycetota bacterium]
MRLVGSHPNLTIARLDQLTQALPLEALGHRPGVPPTERTQLHPHAVHPCPEGDSPKLHATDHHAPAHHPAEPTPPILPPLPPRSNTPTANPRPHPLPLYTPIFVQAHLIDVFA